MWGIEHRLDISNTGRMREWTGHEWPLWVVRTMKISDFFAEPMKISVKHTDLGANSYQWFADHWFSASFKSVIHWFLLWKSVITDYQRGMIYIPQKTTCSTDHSYSDRSLLLDRQSRSCQPHLDSSAHWDRNSASGRPSSWTQLDIIMRARSLALSQVAALRWCKNLSVPHNRRTHVGIICLSRVERVRMSACSVGGSGDPRKKLTHPTR